MSTSINIYKPQYWNLSDKDMFVKSFYKKEKVTVTKLKELNKKLEALMMEIASLEQE